MFSGNKIPKTLTKDFILELEVGPILDGCVAHHLLKWNRTCADNYGYQLEEPGTKYCRTPPKYSAKIELAWPLTELKRQDPGWNYGQRFYYKLDSVICGGWRCEVWDEQKAVQTYGDGSTGINVFSKEAPEAICKAALLTLLIGDLNLDLEKIEKLNKEKIRPILDKIFEERQC